ncbi:MAG: RNA polymerase sigma factor RpoH [Chlamydiales bacterium]
MSTALQLVSQSLPLPEDGLKVYLQRVNAIPLLSAEEEKSLALRYQEEGDLLAAEQLVLSQLRYVVRIAKMYRGYGLAIADLIQEGTIGLMKAVKRFDPHVGVRLVSFAVHWIKSEIHEFIIRNWRIVKVATTKAQRKLFFNLREAKNRLGWLSQEEVQSVAAKLNVCPKEVVEMESRLAAHDPSFEYHSQNEEDDAMSFSPADYIPAAKTHEPDDAVIGQDWETQSQHHLQDAMESLDPRSLDIVSQRWLAETKTSLKALADKYQISIERVRQIEKAAMEKLRECLSEKDMTAFAEG